MLIDQIFKIGGKRTLKLPSQLGYGMRGAGCKGGKHTYPHTHTPTK